MRSPAVTTSPEADTFWNPCSGVSAAPSRVSRLIAPVLPSVSTLAADLSAGFGDVAEAATMTPAVGVGVPSLGRGIAVGLKLRLTERLSDMAEINMPSLSALLLLMSTLAKTTPEVRHTTRR